MKKCSFCNKEVEKLWYANPKCCMSFDCRRKYNEQKGKATKPKKRSRISPISDKKQKELREYRKLRDGYMEANKVCEVRGCGNRSVDLHHKVSREFALLDTDVFMAVCRDCHNRIEAEDKWARDNGYKLSKHNYLGK